MAVLFPLFKSLDGLAEELCVEAGLLSPKVCKIGSTPYLPPLTLPQVDTATLVDLRQRYEETPHVESRTRYQMILLAQQDYQVPQIARIVLRSEDTGARVLKRFLAGGLDAVPWRTPVLAT